MRWAKIESGRVANVVEQDVMPAIPGEWVACGSAGPGWAYDGTAFTGPVPAPLPRHITKRSFWNRFPAAKEETMRAIILSGTPVLLAAKLQRLQARVDGSPHVDLDLAETQGGIALLSSAAVPASVLIDGETMPLRLTAGEADAIINGEIADAERAS